MNILFFHRLDLTHLYAGVSQQLKEEHKIFHIAYSNHEEIILKNKYLITENVYNLSELKNHFYDNCIIDSNSINSLDYFIRNNTDQRFCLSSSILIDRTYENIEYNEAIKLCLAYYQSWIYILEKINPDLFFHELPALFMSHIAAILCKSRGIKYLTQINVVGISEFQWIFLEGDDAIPIEINIHSGEFNLFSKEHAIDFLTKFRSNTDILYSNIIPITKVKVGFPKFSILISIFKLFVRELMSYRNAAVIPKRHIEDYLKIKKDDFFVKLENIFFRYLKTDYHPTIENEKYFFYPLHLEPEAVVLYYGEGWYKGQIKLIENIAMQLPPHTVLYVKDHPLFVNSRNFRDYKELKKIKNIKLIDPLVPGKQIIKNSIAVITINGTAGIEGILMGKPVFTFGNAYFNFFRGVTFIHNIKDLKGHLYEALNQVHDYPNIEDVRIFLNCSHPGFVGFFSGRQNLLKTSFNENSILIAKGIQALIDKLEKSDK